MKFNKNCRIDTLLIIVFLLIIVSSCKKEEDLHNKVKDIDGNVYNSIIIGTQTWTKENLKVTHFNDGTEIPLVIDSDTWGGLTTPAYCWYQNNEVAYKNIYGALYNGYIVSTGKICPAGWHVPSNSEWTALITFLGGDSIAGGKLKESGNDHWAFPNRGATNESGFTALPGGARPYVSQWLNEDSYWWSSTEIDASNAYRFVIANDHSNVYDFEWNKRYGLSIRCIKD